MNPFNLAFEALGTHWSITIWDSLSTDKQNELSKRIIEMCRNFDNTYSRFIKTSLIFELINKRGVVTVPQDFTTMLAWYKKLYLPSDKKLNPLIGFTLSDLGYDAEYSLITQPLVRSTPDLDKAVQIIDATHISLSDSVLFDFGALGKGFLVDKISDMLKNHNLRQFLVDGSGDIKYEGNLAPIRIGLEHPSESNQIIGTLEMTGGALCGSGTYRRKWGKYHHIIDPTLKNSTTGILSAWVLSDSATLSDALATALFLAPPEQFARFDFDFCLVNRELQIKRSAGFKAELFN